MRRAVLGAPQGVQQMFAGILRAGKSKPTAGKAREQELVGVCASARCVREGQPRAAESKIPF